MIYTNETSSNHHIIAFKKIIAKSIPFVSSGAITYVDELCIALMLGKIGNRALGADAIFTSTFDLVMSGTTFLNPITNFVAKAIGGNKPATIKNIIHQGWLFAGILSIPAMTGLWFSSPILKFFRQPIELITMIEPCSKVTAFAVPAIFIVTVDINFLQAIGKDYALVTFYLSQFIIGSGISYVLMFGKLGLPELGFQGTGYAILGQWWTSFVALKVYFYTNRDIAKYRLFKFNLKNLNVLKKLIKLGAYVHFLALSKQSSTFIVEMMNGWFGEKYLIINQAATRGLQFMRYIIAGVNQSTQIHISYFKGKNDFFNMRCYGNVGIAIGAGFATISLLAYIKHHNELANIFIMDTDMVVTHSEIIRELFIIKATCRIIEVIQESIENCLNGLLDTFYPMIIQLLVTLSLTLPLSYMLGYINDRKIFGINEAAGIGAGINAVILLRRWYMFTSNEQTTSKSQTYNLPQNKSELLPMYKNSLKESRSLANEANLDSFLTIDSQDSSIKFKYIS